MSKTVCVTPRQVLAARLAVKRATSAGKSVSPAVQAISKAVIPGHTALNGASTVHSAS
jgi:hypothetical protein